VSETFELVDEPAPVAVGVLGLAVDEVVVAERCSARAKREWPPACRSWDPRAISRHAALALLRSRGARAGPRAALARGRIAEACRCGRCSSARQKESTHQRAAGLTTPSGQGATRARDSGKCPRQHEGRARGARCRRPRIRQAGVASGRPAHAEPTRSPFDLSPHPEAGAGRNCRRRPSVDGADDLAAVDALQVDARDAEVRVLDMRVIWQLCHGSRCGPRRPEGVDRCGPFPRGRSCAMTFVPCLVQSVEGSELVSITLGHPLVDGYLEFVGARGARNTWLAVAYDLKVFFEVIAKEPAEVTTADCSRSWLRSARRAAANGSFGSRTGRRGWRRGRSPVACRAWRVCSSICSRAATPVWRAIRCHVGWRAAAPGVVVVAGCGWCARRERCRGCSRLGTSTGCLARCGRGAIERWCSRCCWRLASLRGARLAAL
jgi:hypothetical protein